MLMRRLGGAAAALALGLCVSAPVCAADDGKPASGGSWLDPFGLFGTHKSEPAPLPPTVPLPPEAAGVPARSRVTADRTPVAEPAPAERTRLADPASQPVARTDLRRDADNYWRRNAVCLRLLEIANSTGNEALRKEAEQLIARNDALLNRRAGLDKPKFESDTATLDRELDSRPAQRDLVAPARPRNEARTANLREDVE